MTTSSNPDLVPNLSGAPWLVRAETRAVFDALSRAGFEARAVGGSVRNALIGRPVNDVDIATPAAPDEVIAAVRAAGLAAHPTGIDHGTITVVANGIPHEVTTLRRDVATDGRRAVVSFSNDWAEDAARRDFTINALYADAGGRIFDPLDQGLRDLAARRVRFIGDPHARIREDFLRILRFFRFSATYSDGRLDDEGLAASASERAGLTRLSAERVHAELRKIFAVAPSALRTVIGAMHTHGFLANLFGAAPAPGRLGRWLEIEAAAGIEPDALARIAALVLYTSNDADLLADRLRMSTDDQRRLAAMAAGLEAVAHPLPDAAATRAAIYRHRASFRDRQAFAWLASGAPVPNADRLEVLRMPDRWSPPRFPVSGADALALGAVPGPGLGAALASVEAAWITGDFAMDRAGCLAALEKVLSQSGKG